MNLILLEPHELKADGRARLSGSRAEHLLGVLRVTPGRTIRVGLVDGPRGRATVQAVEGAAVDLRCDLGPEPPPRPRVDLLLALPRPKVMRRLWAQLAALGAGRIILTNAEKVERPYFDTHVLQPRCYRPLLIEGLQQAGDTRLPSVSIHRRFRVLIEDELETRSDARVRLVADPASPASVSEAVIDELRSDPGSRVLLAIGPEGGWNDFELGLLQSHRFHRVGMGPRTLRTDTACLALLALVHDSISRSA